MSEVYNHAGVVMYDDLGHPGFGDWVQILLPAGAEDRLMRTER